MKLPRRFPRTLGMPNTRRAVGEQTLGTPLRQGRIVPRLSRLVVNAGMAAVM